MKLYHLIFFLSSTHGYSNLYHFLIVSLISRFCFQCFKYVFSWQILHIPFLFNQNFAHRGEFIPQHILHRVAQRRVIGSCSVLVEQDNVWCLPWAVKRLHGIERWLGDGDGGEITIYGVGVGLWGLMLFTDISKFYYCLHQRRLQVTNANQKFLCTQIMSRSPDKTIIICTCRK